MVELGSMALWAAITGGTPLVLASIPVLRSHISDRTIHLMLGLSAGILLGLSLLDILPESFAASADAGLASQVVPIGVAAGFFTLLVVEGVLIGRAPPEGRHMEGHIHYADGRVLAPFGTLALSALAVHGLVDGFVIPLGFELGGNVGTVIVVAVALHQIPDSFAALAVGIASSADRRRAWRYVLLTAVDTPIGILLGIAFLGVGTSLVPIGLAFSAGTFIFVSAADLIPELQHRSRSALVTLSILAGFALVAALALVPF